MRFAVLLGLLSLSSPAQDAFYGATDLLRKGQTAQAAAAYEKAAQDFPQDTIAEDALLEAAQLKEEKLGDPEGALRLYQVLVARYPSSRLFRRAASRIDFLRAGLAAGAEPLRLYQDVLSSYASRPHAESISRMEDLLRRFPAFPMAAHATFWLAEASLQERRFGDALSAYESILARFPGSEWAPRAEKGIGDLWLERGDTARARAAYDRLARRGGVHAAAAELGRAAVRSHLVRRGFITGSSALLGALLLAYALRARKGPFHMPLELKYYLPVAAAFSIAAATEHVAIFRATIMVAATGALLTFLVGQKPVPRGRRALHAAAITCAVAAIFIVAIQSQHLTDMMLETLRQGAER